MNRTGSFSSNRFGTEPVFAYPQPSVSSVLAHNSDGHLQTERGLRAVSGRAGLIDEIIRGSISGPQVALGPTDPIL